MLADHLHHLLADPPRRIQGGHRLLKNHRHACAAPLAQLFLDAFRTSSPSSVT
jgi:predicted DNA-binding protein with PD1-like motif